MKFAFVDGIKTEAKTGLAGTCIGCGSSMIPKCGDTRIHHWSHSTKRECDVWWENETAWHRSWKELFPATWQEIVHFEDDGERHIADVKTENGWVLEFQHSFLKPEERRSRDSFYKKIVWVVDGTRLKKDQTQFISALNSGRVHSRSPLIVGLQPASCNLLKVWGETDAPVFVDFGLDGPLWWILPKTTNGFRYVAAFSKVEFVRLHLVGTGADIQNFETFVSEFSELVTRFVQGKPGPR